MTLSRSSALLLLAAVLCGLIATGRADDAVNSAPAQPATDQAVVSPAGTVRQLENTPCYAEYACVNSTKGFDGDDPPIGQMPISHYPVWDKFHGFLMTWHDCWAGLTLLLLLHNILYNGTTWLPCCWRNKGKPNNFFTRHQVLGSLCLKITVPLAIFPALFDCWFWRPRFLVRIIGLYGCSFLACTMGGLVLKWYKNKIITRLMFVFHLANSVYFTYDWLYILGHFEVFGGAPLLPDGKVSKLCKEMTVIVLAFALWEPYNAFVLYRFGAVTKGVLDTKKFDVVRHHMLNMLFLFVLAVFGPALFFFHDTAHLWIPENGFPVHGLPWYVRMLGMLFTTVVPILLPWALYLPRQGRTVNADGSVTKIKERTWAWGPYVDHFVAAWKYPNGPDVPAYPPVWGHKKPAAPASSPATPAKVHPEAGADMEAGAGVGAGAGAGSGAAVAPEPASAPATPEEAATEAAPATSADEAKEEATPAAAAAAEEAADDDGAGGDVGDDSDAVRGVEVTPATGTGTDAEAAPTTAADAAPSE